MRDAVVTDTPRRWWPAYRFVARCLLSAPPTAAMTLLGCGVLDFHHDTDAVLILARGHLRDAVACVALHVVVDAVHVVYCT